MSNQILLGDCLDVLKTLPDASCDAVISDPPYGLGTREPTGDEIIAYLQGAELDTSGDFMGREWSIPPVSVWRECLRVLKPGGHLLSFGGTRTFDLISIGIRAAGFECRDTVASQFGVQCLQWIQGQGFPKSLNVRKALEKAGADPEVAKQWEGWGTALKPSWEPILVFRKPTEESTVAKQMATTGTGAMNIDACRVKANYAAHELRPNAAQHSKGVTIERVIGPVGLTTENRTQDMGYHNSSGRWPANLVFTHLDTCKPTGTKKVAAPVINRFDDGMKPFGDGAGHEYTSEQTGDADGMEEVSVYSCEDGCPVKALDAQGVAIGVHGPGNKGPAVFKEDPWAAYIESVGGDGSDAGGWETGHRRNPNYHPDAGGVSRFFSQFEPEQEPPAYECTDGCPVKTLDEQSGILASHGGGTSKSFESPLFGERPTLDRRHIHPGDAGGASRFFSQFEPAPPEEPDYECTDGCPVKALDGQSGELHARGNVGASKGGGGMYGHKPILVSPREYDSGGASRFFGQFEPDAPFFYTAKTSKAERDRGLAKGTNRHPTVKPNTLMRWLVKLVTPWGGVVLDPYCGSGSTGVAALNEGCSFIGIERDPEFHHVAELRLKAAAPPPDVFDTFEGLE